MTAGNGPSRSREVAEHLFEDAVRADTDPDNKSTLVTLVQTLAKVTPASHRKLITRVAKRMATRANGAPA